MSAPIRVIIVDDHDIVRTGLVSFLQTQSHIEVVGDFGGGEEALSRLSELTPQVVIMDITMPEMDGMQATRAVKEAFPECQVLVLTVHEDKEFFFEMLSAGASGYLTKEAAAEELIHAIQSVAQGYVYLQPTLARWLLDDYQRLTSNQGGEPYTREQDHPDLEVLSLREKEVLELVATGLTNTEIGKALGISPNTVARHRERIMNKINLHSCAELTRFAVRTGLIEA